MMKKLLSILVAAVLLAIPFMGAAEEPMPQLTYFRQMWNQYNPAYLTRLGLTEEEAQILTAERAVVAAGKELVYTITASLTTGDPETDAVASAWLGQHLLTARLQQNELALSSTLNGTELLSIGYGELGGVVFFASNLLPDPVALTEEGLETLPLKLVNAAQTAGLIDDLEAMNLGYQLSVSRVSMMTPWYIAALEHLAQEADPEMLTELDLTAWNAAMAPVLARMKVSEVTEQPGDCDAAATVWNTEVTPQDLNALMTAALMTVRDNPALLEVGAAMLEAPADQIAQMIDMSLQSYEDIELFGGESLILTGWNNASGEQVRLVIEFYDDVASVEASEDTLDALTALQVEDDTVEADLTVYIDAEAITAKRHFLTATHTRNTVDGVVQYRTLLSDDQQGFLFSLDEGEGLWRGSVEMIWDSVTEFAITLEMKNSLVRENDETRLSASVLLTTYEDLTAYGGTAQEMTLLQAAGDVFIRPEGYNLDASFASDHMMEEPVALRLMAEYAVADGSITGTERCEVTIGEGCFTVDCLVKTQEPQASIFDSGAKLLQTLSEEELTAWLGGVAEAIQTWEQEVRLLLPEALLNELNSMME